MNKLLGSLGILLLIRRPTYEWENSEFNQKYYLCQIWPVDLLLLFQVLAATPHKTPTVRPPASYHKNYSS